MNAIAHALLGCSLAGVAGAADYHVAADGDDARDGRTPATAWRSLARAATAQLEPGDRILLRGGDAFHGALVVARSGAADRPITIASFGSGRASIHPPAGGDGIAVVDAAHVVIRDLDVLGPGAEAAPGGSGIRLHARARRNAGIVVRDVACRDFPRYGIELACDAVGAGLEDLLVDRVDCSGCGEAGMASWGPTSGDAYSFERVTVRDSRFHGNRGRPAKKDNHSGNGIVLGDCRRSLIERCAAWANGDLCRAEVGGPVGIWLCESDRSVIRGCVSFRNRTGPSIWDGGGFDLDGGCTGCVIERCLSWRNDGAGYLVCQYGGARPLHDNIVRDCWSIGDGRGRNNGAVYVVGDLRRTLVAHCTLVVEPTESHAACWRLAGDAQDLQVRNDRHLVLGDAPQWPDTTARGASFAGNRWQVAPGFACLAGDAVDAAVLSELPASIDAPWLATLPPTPGTPAPIDPAWVTVLREAGCDTTWPSVVGAVARPAYGPARAALAAEGAAR